MTGAATEAQSPAVYRRRFGDVLVTVLGDGYLDLPASLLLGITEEEAGALLHQASQPLPPRSSVNAFLLQLGSDAGDRTVLVDTGAGSVLGPTAGHLPRNLAAAGVPPDSIDLVLLTHLHPDHSGGLVRDGQPVFPNAELALSDAEAGFWLDPGNEERVPEPMRPMFAMARNSVAPYQGRMRRFQPGSLEAGITAEPLPGHTPGHTGFRIGSGQDALLIWGDTVHVPDIQVRRPDVSTGYDVDPVQAASTRRVLLDRVAAENTVIAGMHTHFPAFSRVVRDKDCFRLAPES